MADLPSIFHALAAVKREVGAVGKDQRNTMQNFSFRGVDAVVNAAAPHLNAQGVITVPEVLDSRYETVEIGSKRTPMAHVVLTVAYRFYGPAGDHVSATVVSEAMDSGDKAIAKGMSVAYRIALLQVLNLPTTDPDPDESSFERSAREAAPAPRASAGERNSASPAKKAAFADLKTPQEFLKAAEGAPDVASLRALYKAAGVAGLLKEKILGGGETV